MESLEEMFNKIEFLDNLLENIEIKTIQNEVLTEIYEKRKQTIVNDEAEVKNLLNLKEKKAKLDKSFIISSFLKTNARKKIVEYKTMIEKLN
ncbi:MAG: hypothetical protein HN778_20435 [Prolixibacteraceae bacterium]|jgi:hypothetical protein|nr:hypothetical protein [Prolixibacteraceae bacterium]MBT6767279.1 hypothetical protein [Prolixibacteraceae bacterium]MBT7000133.1 hypothetical protein [Prolixibacteraceae bacterium]MBT7397205.1 hypothetical protein [Prolixibacteraceae bacterium]